MPAPLSAWLGEAARLVHACIEAATRWGPAGAVGAVFALAVIEAVALPRRIRAKAIWVLVVAACGVLAAGDLRWQAREAQSAVGGEIAALQGLWDQWDRLSRTLPAASETPAASFETVDDALASLSARVAGIEGQIAVLKERSKGRSISDEAAAKLADYLRQFGSYPAVVSCVPDDVEAYNYANQLVNILRAAGWDARGPEVSAVRDGATAMGVTILVRDPHAPEAAKIVLDTLTRFNIPYQSGIAASDAIPDNATVELFVAKKP
jgi:hypothetical protein